MKESDGVNMYKITLYDENCSPICDGTTSFFTDKLNAKLTSGL